MSPLRQGLLFAVVTGAAVALGILVHVQTSPREPVETPPPSAARLLAASLPDLQGHPQRFDQWRGKILVVNFWATWCVPCRKEIPEFIQVQKEYGPKGLQIVGVAIDQTDKVKPYAAEVGINYPVLIGDQDGIELSRVAGNSVGALPFTIVLDRTGSPISNQLGRMDRERLEQLVRPLL